MPWKYSQTHISFNELNFKPDEYLASLEFDEKRVDYGRRVSTEVQIEIKYAGSIKRQLGDVEHMSRLEKMKMPENIDYKSILGLRLEARAKLDAVRPRTLGQAPKYPQG